MKESKTIIKDYNEIFEAAPIGMAIASLEGVILKVNQEFCNTIGYSADDLIQKSFTWFTHPDDLKKNLDRNKQIIDGKISAHQMEKRYFHRNGDIIHIVLKVSSLKDSEGKPEFLLGQILDITERVKFAQEKERSEKYFRMVFDKAPIGVALIDLDLNFIRTNKALQKLLQYSKQELKQLSIKDITHPDDLSVNLKQDSELIDGKKESFSMEKRYLRKDGKVIEGLLKVSIVRNADGGQDQFIGQVVDITQLKSYENLLQENIEQLLKVNQEMDSFVYRASHDLRGPLASMKGLLNLYRSAKPSDNLFEKMDSSLEKMENVINMLSEFSTSASSAQQKKEINIKSYLNTIIKRFEPIARDKEINIIIEGLDEVVSIDLQRFQLIMKHLLLNAIQFHDRKESAFVIIRAYFEDQSLKVLVEDNGPGMEEGIKNRAFEMFYRGNESSQGSGMGLYIVKENIAKMQGEISLHSKPIIGTRVLLRFPL